MKLVIINTLSEDKIKSLKKAVPGAIVESYKSPKEAIPHVADADAIAMWGFQDVEPILAAGPNIRWVHSLSDGVERLLSPSMLSRPIHLTNSHGVHGRAVSEHTLALLLAWMRRIPDAVRHQSAHEWIRPRGDTLFGKTILIVGFGSIGRALAERDRRCLHGRLLERAPPRRSPLLADGQCHHDPAHRLHGSRLLGQAHQPPPDELCRLRPRR